MSYILDTNIVSAIMKKDAKILAKIQTITLARQRIFISCVTYFEIQRGLIPVNATKKMASFEQICQRYPVILLDDLAIMQKAAEIHADLKVRGLPIQTEDILIAATAIIKGLILVSNDSDLTRVNGLNLEKWL